MTSAGNYCLFVPDRATIQVCSSSSQLSRQCKGNEKNAAIHCAENMHLRYCAVGHALFIAAGKCFLKQGRVRRWPRPTPGRSVAQ